MIGRTDLTYNINTKTDMIPIVLVIYLYYEEVIDINLLQDGMLDRLHAYDVYIFPYRLGNGWWFSRRRLWNMIEWAGTLYMIWYDMSTFIPQVKEVKVYP